MKKDYTDNGDKLFVDNIYNKNENGNDTVGYGFHRDNGNFR